VRRVRAIGLQRRDELHSDSGQIGYKLLARVDGRPLLADAALEAAKGNVEALQYAEQRAAGKLDRLHRENKEASRGRAERDLRNARDAFTAAVNGLAQARAQMVAEATLVSFLVNDGATYAQPAGDALQFPDGIGTTRPISIPRIIELMLEEAAGIEEGLGSTPIGLCPSSRSSAPQVAARSE
jgi:hypothetical protein